MSRHHAFTCMCPQCIAAMDGRPSYDLRVPFDQRQTTHPIVLPSAAAVNLLDQLERTDRLPTMPIAAVPLFSNTPESEAWRDYHTVDA